MASKVNTASGIMYVAAPFVITGSVAASGATGTITSDGYVYGKTFLYVGAAGSTSRIGSTADGKLTVANNAGSIGATFDLTTDTLVKVWGLNGTTGGALQVGRGLPGTKSLRFIRGNDAEEPTFGFHTDATATNNLVFGVSSVNRVVLSNNGTTDIPLGVIVSSAGAFGFSSTTDAAAGTLSNAIYSGSGSPETVVAAKVGSLYLRTNGGAGTCLYVKESGSNTNTGWIAK